MALFAQEIAYTPVAWKALMKEPANRLEVVREVVARLGGRLVDGWFTFGDFDALVICELPDNVSAAAFSMAVNAGGAMRATPVNPTPDNDLKPALAAQADATHGPELTNPRRDPGPGIA